LLDHEPSFPVPLVLPGAPDIGMVHDWLVTSGGAEQVLSLLVRLFRPTRLYAMVEFLAQADRRRLLDTPIETTFIQRLPFARSKYWYYNVLMPLAGEQLDVTGHDIILSSSHSAAKGVICDPDQLHLCYLHSPIRFAWDLQPYYMRKFGYDHGPRWLMAALAFHYLRVWDQRTAHGADLLIANSDFVRRRGLKVYGRDAVVVHPPIDCDRFGFCADRDETYLCGSYFNPFKSLDVIIDAFAQMPDRRLLVFGDGPQREALRRRATANITFLGRLSDAELVRRMQQARAFVFAAPEDFGMIIAEAQAAGTPVIAFNKGGAREIIRTGAQGAATGVLFDRQQADCIVDAVGRFEQQSIDPSACRANALRFDTGVFVRRMNAIVACAWEGWRSGYRVPALNELKDAADAAEAGAPSSAAAVPSLPAEQDARPLR